ncbi:GGDEF domain-containing protein [Henriciella sp.]|uniref:GGDEF domain-containing protein n=1 Tax=Henriciella sp. TaxID=1968823 RepID=UPI002629933B|nr:GGDEF domain-containing protein [Henriciella sp.]
MYFDALITESPVRVSYRRAALITILTLVTSQIGTALAILVTDIRPEVLNEIIVIWFVIAAVVSTTLAFPLAIVFQRERLKLARAMKQLEEVHAELARRARIDPLTGVLNRDAFLSGVDGLKAQKIDGAMLMIDIDHFKVINDTYGHSAGDEALIMVARTIRSVTRKADLVGRLGGEEFGVFIPGENIELAKTMAERIRDTINRLQFCPEPRIHHRITVSIGVSQGSWEAKLTDQFRLADQGMYTAKHAGRNRVELCAAA